MPVDDEGNPLVDDEGNPVQVNEDGMVVDSRGNPIVDDEGNPLMVGGDDDDDDVPGSGMQGPSDSATELADCSTPGPRQLRRLTAAQYRRTLEDIFNDPNVPEEAVLSDAAVLGFHVDAKTSVVRDLEGELLMNYAERVAEWALDSGKVNQFASCTDHQEHCHREFISNFGAKAHREPLSEARLSAYLELFRAESNFQDGASVVISAMLQSPFTLYRREMGVQQGNEYVLTPYEVASQLSYWLTDAPPDDQLYDAAKNGRLTTTEDLEREAARLLETERAKETLANFVEGWIEVDKLYSKAKDESVMPLPAELRESMVRETREMFVNTFAEGGTLSDLFTAKHSYIDQRLASLYGLNGFGQNFERVDMTETNRPAGILGHASFLTTHALSDNSSPVQRAKIVIERLLCETLPMIPSDLNVALDTESEFTTNRERYRAHRERPECSGCHENMDPIGFAFEHYDGFGRYREQENGIDIDATGSLAYLASGRVELDGADSLSAVLADSPEMQSCLVRYWSYYTFGAEGWDNAECNRDSVVRHAREDDFSLRSVLMGIVAGPHFSRRVADQ